MTYLPAQVQGQWFYLYLILDLYSRKIVGWEIHDRDDAGHAVHLVKRTALAEGVHAMHDKPVLHGDNGSTLKATTVLAMLHWPGVKPSYSRPRVSDDNALVESLFKTAKYRPELPPRGFATLDDARGWGHDFVRWYNFEHRGTAAFATSRPRSAMPARTTRSCKRAIERISRREHAIRHAGPVAHATGRRSAPSRSIPSAMPSFAAISMLMTKSGSLHKSGDNYLDSTKASSALRSCFHSLTTCA